MAEHERPTDLDALAHWLAAGAEGPPPPGVTPDAAQAARALHEAARDLEPDPAFGAALGERLQAAGDDLGSSGQETSTTDKTGQRPVLALIAAGLLVALAVALAVRGCGATAVPTPTPTTTVTPSAGTTVTPTAPPATETASPTASPTTRGTASATARPAAAPAVATVRRRRPRPRPGP